MDGHHKLIHWDIVIHGIVDGYCYTVVQSYLNTFFDFTSWNAHPISEEGHNQSSNVSAMIILNHHVFITNKHCKTWDLLDT